MTEVLIDEKIVKQISNEIKVKPSQVESVLKLLDEGNTIPFIARYRKEVTGSLDEVQIHSIEQQYTYTINLRQRKEEVARLIAEQDKITDELLIQLEQATSLQQIEDIYRPFKQKRRTKAMIAIENGLEPLAEWLLSSTDADVSPETKASEYLSEVIATSEAALAGAHEIIAQYVSDDANYREFIRKYTRYNARLVTKLKDEKKDEQQVYQMYYDYSEAIQKLPEHRILAINRAEKENVLSVKLVVEEAPIIRYIEQRIMADNLPVKQKELVALAIRDSYKRFIGPAIEREIRNEATERADKQAIQVFGDNLRHLLLQPPLKGRVVLGFDPAYRTGCKLAVINDTGRVLDKAVIYPHPPASARQRAAAGPELIALIEKHQIDVIAIGNGTASRESEQFVSEIVKQLDRKVQFIIVNEAGASVYSASAIARQEFPDFQVEERSAVSIARRLQDPLAELIKIDPKSMGVGQYQHDVAQTLLTEELDFVVNITVNQIGVDINTASVPLLQHVSGLTKTTANNIVLLRDEIGHFDSRQQIKKVKRLGPKTFEQAVGFLRILGGENPLDQTSIHPESYGVAKAILKDAEVSLNELGSDLAVEKLSQLKVKELSKRYDLGTETLTDIIDGLKHPTADIRDGHDAPILREDVMSLDDLYEGMQLQGVIRNVVDFGAFVDIGVKQDGLIHISKLSKKFIKHPSEAVSIGDIVEVEVISIEKAKNRIGLKRLFNK